MGKIIRCTSPDGTNTNNSDVYVMFIILSGRNQSSNIVAATPIHRAHSKSRLPTCIAAILRSRPAAASVRAASLPCNSRCSALDAL